MKKLTLGFVLVATLESQALAGDICQASNIFNPQLRNYVALNGFAEYSDSVKKEACDYLNQNKGNTVGAGASFDSLAQQAKDFVHTIIPLHIDQNQQDTIIKFACSSDSASSFSQAESRFISETFGFDLNRVVDACTTKNADCWKVDEQEEGEFSGTTVFRIKLNKVGCGATLFRGLSYDENKVVCKGSLADFEEKIKPERKKFKRSHDLNQRQPGILLDDSEYLLTCQGLASNSRDPQTGIRTIAYGDTITLEFNNFKIDRTLAGVFLQPSQIDNLPRYWPAGSPPTEPTCVERREYTNELTNLALNGQQDGKRIQLGLRATTTEIGPKGATFYIKGANLEMDGFFVNVGSTKVIESGDKQLYLRVISVQPENCTAKVAYWWR